jgi:hypothetical protein
MPSSIISNFSNAQHLQEMAITAIESQYQRPSEDIVSLSPEDQERKAFMGEINKFMAEIGKPLNKIPIMGYKELDLYQLYKEVVAAGGFLEVVKNVGTWSKIWKKLGNFDPSITDSSFRLKKNYERYLLEYEYKMFPEHRLQALELEKQMQMKKQNGEQTSPKSQERKPKSTEEKSKPKTKRTISRKPTYTSYKDIVRDKSGAPKMPLCLGELTIESLGSIIAQPPYTTEKHIWPVGFTSCRYFTSMINPDKKVKYTSQIIDGGDKPQFMVTAEDDPINPIVSHSPSGIWRTVLKRVMGKSASEDSRKNVSVSGTLRFGLAHPIVSHLIRELPGAEKCKDLSWSSSSPSNSPTFSRKRTIMEESDTEEAEAKRLKYEDEEYDLEEYDSHFSGRGVTFTSTSEIEDLEVAVATLQALKYCAVY